MFMFTTDFTDCTDLPASLIYLMISPDYYG